MSHFLALVLVDPADPNPIDRAQQLMTPFWARDPFDEETGQESPNVKCDGFTVGGRYDGVIWGQEPEYSLSPDAFQRRYGFDVVRPENNMRPASQVVLDPYTLPHAVVTPDGRWLSSEGKPIRAWRDELVSLLDEHGDRLAVAIDCHF
ncbi:hypothetical protein AB0F17_04010 [Nonomuraea sp. NPDC026600]|uniref:hypothetical protein n=1 Tax=Nonomuraea sp. NPDC026600 TaxID=3155363 RepID=UPI0033F99934